jgi:hypothetical protein
MTRALRLLVLPLGMVFMLAPSVAAAQIANAVPVNQRSTTVNGSIPNICVMQQPRLAAGAQVNFLGLTGTTLRIDALVDPLTLATRAASINLSLDAVCNFPHRLRIEAQNNGLFRSSNTATQTPNGFASAIPYTASINWGPQGATLNADALVRRVHEEAIAVANPTAGQVLLRLDIQPGASNVQSNAPVIAGNYGDVLRVTLEPRQ